MGNRQNRWIQKKFKALRKARGGRCLDCGSGKDLEFAHIKETTLSGRNSRGRKERYYDIKNNPQCYVLLCEPCHGTRDKKIFHYISPIAKRGIPNQ